MDAMKGLNEREQRILQARRLAEPPLTLEDLAGEFNVSRERIRQIEVRAFEKLQKAVSRRARSIRQKLINQLSNITALTSQTTDQ